MHLGLGHGRDLAKPEQLPLHLGAGHHQRQPNRDRLGGVPQRVQGRDQQVEAKHRAGQPQPATARRGGEQRPAKDRGPQPVPDRGQDAAQDLGLDQIDQRQAVAGEQGVEGVAGAFEGGEPVKTLDLSRSVQPIAFAWMPDARSVAYVASVSGSLNVWTQPIDGTAPKQLTNFKSNLISNFAISRDGKIAAYRFSATRDIVLIKDFQ